MKDKVKILVDCIKKAHECNGYSHQTLRGVLTLWRCALLQQEDEYVETVHTLSEGAVRHATRGFGVLLQHFCVDDSYEDLLGPAYMMLAENWGKERLGQYFTPWNVAVAMAEMTVADHDFDENPALSIMDPAVGSGVMLLACRHVVAKRKGRNVASRLTLAGQDIDPVCVDMAKIQVMMTDDYHMMHILLDLYGQVRATMQERQVVDS